MLEFLDLDIAEQHVAATVVASISDRLPWNRVVAVFRALSRGERLAFVGKGAQGVLPLANMSLLRNERAIAVAAELTLNLTCEEEGAQRIIATLAHKDGAFQALLFDACRRAHRSRIAMEQTVN